MICLPLQQFVALMEALAWDTPPVGLRLILPFCVNTGRASASSGESAGSQNFRIFWVQFAFADLLEGVDFSLAKFLGGDGRAYIAEISRENAVLCFSGGVEGKVGVARCWDEHNSGFFFSVCKENGPSFPPRWFFHCYRAGNNTEVNCKISSAHLTVCHIIFPWHPITFFYSFLFWAKCHNLTHE